MLAHTKNTEDGKCGYVHTSHSTSMLNGSC